MRDVHATSYPRRVLVSTYHLSDTERARARRQWVDARPFVIGRAGDCAIVIDDPEVADHHLRVTSRDGQISVENLAPGTDVDGTPVAVHAAIVVGEGHPIRIGGTIVKLRLQAVSVVTTQPPVGPPVMPLPPTNPPPPVFYGTPPNPPAPPPPPARVRPRKPTLSPEPTEQRFLNALRANPGDAESRMVYADWLEGNGLNAKAQLVRLREHLDTFMHKNASDLDWRAVAVRTPIDHCIQNRCPGSWDVLAPDPTTDFVRACGVCRRQVRYCAELADVRVAGWERGPAVFDAALDRVAAHATYRDPYAPLVDDGDEIEDDPDGYTLDSPPTPFRR